MHAMMEWQCQQAEMDFMALDSQFPLSTISKQIIGGGVELPEAEAVNTVDLMSSASEDGEEGESHAVDDSEDEDDEAASPEDGEEGESPAVADSEDEAGSPVSFDGKCGDDAFDSDDLHQIFGICFVHFLEPAGLYLIGSRMHLSAGVTGGRSTYGV